MLKVCQNKLLTGDERFYNVLKFIHIFKRFLFKFFSNVFTPTLPVELNCRRAVVFTVLFHSLNVFITYKLYLVNFIFNKCGGQ